LLMSGPKIVLAGGSSAPASHGIGSIYGKKFVSNLGSGGKHPDGLQEPARRGSGVDEGR